ncbi:MAG: deoxyribodipyrimidine photo-lyase [Hyphomicrobiaceae bacterium]
MKRIGHCLHWFRNDLRLDDNRALASAVAFADRTTCLFVIDTDLLAAHKRATKRRAFMAACLGQLERDLAKRGLTLLLVAGRADQVIPEVVTQLDVARVTFGRDYSPLAKRRDASVVQALQSMHVEIHTTKDRVVFEADEVRTKGDTPYRVYTPYRRTWLQAFASGDVAPIPLPQPRRQAVDQPSVDGSTTATELSIGEAMDLINPDRASTLIPGGEDAAQRALTRFIESQMEHYDQHRDIAAADATSRLSPYLRFGVISARRCLDTARAALGEGGQDGAATWMDQIVWREFYTAILDSFPDVLEASFKPETAAIRWNIDDDAFRAWCEGRTGYPFVDAGMRQLVSEGWMHNRARMVTASFLVKDLLIDWRLGQRFFAQHLLDGDPALNNGGWQWCASTGTDAQPYFRIFNPTRQGQRFDPDGQYVSKWVPELREVPKRWIHEPWKAPHRPAHYPLPIVDHSRQRSITVTRFQAARGRHREQDSSLGHTP